MGIFWDWLSSVLSPIFTAQGYLWFYGFAALSHLLVQYTFAIMDDVRRRRQAESKARHRQDQSKRPPDSLAIWIPVYQEKIEWLQFCLRNAEEAAQFFKDSQPGRRIKVIVVDDGSYLGLLEKYRGTPPQLSPLRRLWNWLLQREPEDYQERYEYYWRKRKELEAELAKYWHNPLFQVIKLTKNVGKRHAQQEAWRHSKGYELYGTIDSDTGVDKDAFVVLAKNFANPKVAAATGYVDVGNWKESWLTRLIDMRYWSAFHVERAAQSFWRCVMCCSGPLAVYRADVADRVIGRYSTQRFLDKYCTFGDDRHLTNLVLAEGYEVVMDPRSHCLTDVPSTLRVYITQQDRWNKSFYREMLWSLLALAKHSKYMTYDLIMQFLLPFMLLGGLGVTLFLAITGDGWATMVEYLVVVLGIGFVRSLFPFFFRRSIGVGRRFGQLTFMVYGVIHVCILTPVRIRALVGLWLGRTGWGTRQT